MNTPSTLLQREAIAAFTHIFLSLDLLESDHLNDDHRSYLAIIRQNAERLQQMIQHTHAEILNG